MSKPQVCEREFDFALLLTGPTELTDATADALFAAGCDDATFGNSAGTQTGDFDREAADFAEAVSGARCRSPARDHRCAEGTT